MLKGNGNRILPILAAVLVSLGLGVLLVLLFLREPDGMRFDESLISAEFALESGNRSLVKRELLVASRHAISAHNWRSILHIAGRAIPDDAKPDDYRLFATLSGRSAAALPGDEELRAFWAWALLRKGDLAKADKAAEGLSSPRWNPLISEITLKTAIGADPEDLEDFISMINPENDPEFLKSAATRTNSAELALDAALLYMYSSRVDEAYKLARDVMDGLYRWNDPETPIRRGIPLALASIAQDYGDKEAAIDWLSPRIDMNRDRRALTWQELQMLGDLHWDRFLMTGAEVGRESASEAWREAMAIVFQASIADAIPPGSWRIWLNQAVLEESRGRIRESRRLLDEALTLYPGRYEVKASWALEMRDDEPALARRLARTAYEETENPVLGITAIRLDPESVSPRIYEARLWELFEAATRENGEMQASDARIIAIFLLEYMSSRKNYSSIDVAVERYLKAHPDSDWILSWRLAADAARGMGMLNLVPPKAGAPSSYENMRISALSEGSWRGLHDSAMYAVMTARELENAAGRLFNPYASQGGSGSYPVDSAILAVLEPLSGQAHIKDQPIGDRLNLIFRNREDTTGDRKRLKSGGKRGDIAKADAVRALEDQADQLRVDALDSLDEAHNVNSGLTGEEKASILYLEALILRDLGRTDESADKAAAAIKADPEHTRARELLS